MKLFLTVFCAMNLLFLGSAFAQTTPSQLLQGSWGTTMSSQSGVSIDMTITIHDQTLVVSSVCSKADQIVQAEVTVPVSYTDQQLNILSTGLKTEYSQDHNVTCNAYVRMSIQSYSIQGNELTLTDSDPSTAMPFVLQRRGY